MIPENHVLLPRFQSSFQEASWFDEPRHRKNILTTRLAADASRVRGIVAERIGLSTTHLSSRRCLALIAILVGVSSSSI